MRHRPADSGTLPVAFSNVAVELPRTGILIHDQRYSRTMPDSGSNPGGESPMRFSLRHARGCFPKVLHEISDRASCWQGLANDEVFG